VVLLCLIPLLGGMGLATVSDVEMTTTGTILAGVAVLFTALSQIFTSSYQKKLKCDAMQLLYHTSPLIAGGMFTMSPVFDDRDTFLTYQWSAPMVRDVLISCFFALLVNITNYEVLGKTSPLTYQVLGHVKTILILFLGFLVFGKESNARELTGIAIALGGVVSYTEVKRRVSERNLLPTSK